VIHESSYWKKPLLESSEKFKAFKELSDIDEETYVEIEKDIFVGFYSIRKLIETETKVTDDLKSGKHNISWFEHNGDEVTWRNNHKIDQLYNLEKSHSEKRDLWFIASRITHSFIFNLCVNETGGFDGVLFTSDSDKNKKLYTLSLNEIINLFELVGNNDVTEIKWHRCPETRKEVTIVK
jgi:hypothetical protein